METPVSSKSPFLFDTGDIVPQGADDIWWRVIQSDEKEAILREAHLRSGRWALCRRCYNPENMAKRVMVVDNLEDTIRYGKECDLC